VPKCKKQSLHKTKRPTVIRSEWAIVENRCVAVLSGHVTLSTNGLEYTCLDCEKVQVQRAYNSANIDPHVKTAGYLSKKAFKENTRMSILAGI